jgi:ferredoxin-thioredoxin reductase catalytic subunit/glutaredoxin
MTVKLYRLTTCYKCDQVEAFLNSKSVSFESVVVDELKGDEQERMLTDIYRLTGQRSFPVVDIDGNTVIGFDEKKLRHLLNLPAREGAAKAASKAIREVVTTKQVEGLLEWIKNTADAFGCKVNPDKAILQSILDGLIKNERRYGYRSCPCRLASGDYLKDSDIICPCAYMSWDLEVYGRCYCSLYVNEKYIANDQSLPQYLIDSRESGRGVLDIGQVHEAKKVLPSFKTHLRFASFLVGSFSRDKIKEGFINIVESIGLKQEDIKWREIVAVAVGKDKSGNQLMAKMDQGMDVYTYQIWFPQKTDFEFIRGSIVDADIFIYDQQMTGMEVEKALGGKEGFGSILRDDIRVYGDFDFYRGGRDRFVITADPVRITEDALEAIIKEITILENCYYLLRNERQKYILSSDRMNDIEAGLVGKFSAISMNLPKATPDDLREWLYTLSTKFGEIAGISEEVRHYSSDTGSRIELIRNILKEWGEMPIEGRSSLNRFYLSATVSLGDDYQRLSRRIDGLRREMIDLMTNLRTKVDLNIQEQSLELQKSVDETTKTQVKLQRTVEGLSVIIISYYIVSLAKFVFEGIKSAGIINVSSTLLTALFVPIAIIISFLLTKEVKEWWVRKKEKK